mmetsp:Transcript_17225/g.27047  ORF Transcript_17225/g.27047 Transcript_17225/m.27047 type:complete len:90 (+) Transcript_17225:816-1085(+)
MRLQANKKWNLHIMCPFVLEYNRSKFPSIGFFVPNIFDTPSRRGSIFCHYSAEQSAATVNIALSSLPPPTGDLSKSLTHGRRRIKWGMD